MIENVHSREDEDGTGSTAFSFKPPKNIKQIGEGTSQKKIYVEDYVVTYIKELSKREYSECRIAVLLGHYIKTKEERIILVNGAVEAEGIQFDADVVFNNDTWTSIYDNIKRYFRDVEVVGWCIGGPGFLLENEEKLKKIHLDNFAGVDKALMTYDSMEQEEAFYIYEHGGLNRQKGYYIYYDKNEDMQNYIIEHKPAEAKSIKEDEKEAAVREYKEEIKEQKVQENNKNIMHLLYAAGSLMVVIVIVAFAVMLNNNSEIRDLKKTVSEINETLYAGGPNEDKPDNSQVQVADQDSRQESSKQENTMEVETISGKLNSIKTEEVIGDKAETDKTEDDTKKEEEAKAAEEPKKEEQPQAEDKKPDTGKDDKAKSEPMDSKKDEGKNSNEKQENKSEESTGKKSESTGGQQEAKATSASTGEIKYYEVQKGDTLVGISFKLYNSGDYVTKIMKLNGIEDMDMIYYGQKLIVP